MTCMYLKNLFLIYLIISQIYPLLSGVMWGPKVGQLYQKSVLFANDALFLVPDPQANIKDWPKSIQWTSHKMFS